MEACKVRLQYLVLEHVKNVTYGQIQMPGYIKKDNFSTSADIVGIYGQNGSGKTAVVDSLQFLQKLMCGKSIPAAWNHYIEQNQSSASLLMEFTVERNKVFFEVQYQIVLRHGNDGTVEIEQEVLSFARQENEARKRMQAAVEFSADGETLFEPKKRLEQLVTGHKELKFDLKVAKKLARLSRSSYIFSDESRQVLESTVEGGFEECSYLIHTLHQYAKTNLFVVNNIRQSAIATDMMLPMPFRMENDKNGTRGDFFIDLREPTILEDKKFRLFEEVLKNVNIVLSAIIPGLALVIKQYGRQFTKKGEEGIRFELFSQRKDAIIPIRYESEGIVKMISILNVLMCAYNDPYICLVVDEFDAGVYEYLLGELLDIFERGGKGQLIFTSHNLRPLEMIDKSCVVFSTANPENRYVRMQNIKRNNNLRDVYLRCITLGGQKECMYEETDSLKIARAFRNAGRDQLDGE